MLRVWGRGRERRGLWVVRGREGDVRGGRKRVRKIYDEGIIRREKNNRTLARKKNRKKKNTHTSTTNEQYK